jgi:hypothetical protein
VARSAAQDLAPAAVTGGVVQFEATGPIRIFDSRALGFGNPLDMLGLGGGHLIPFPAIVPPGATGAMVNITVVVEQPGSFGYAAALGDGLNETSTVNWGHPGVYANFAFVPVHDFGAHGAMLLRLAGNHPVHVIVDLEAWVVPGPV